MIEMLAALMLASDVQVATSDVEMRRTQVASCRDRQAELLILSGKLGQPDTDRPVAAREARNIQIACTTAAATLLADAWTEPCGRLMVHIASHAGGLADVYQGMRSEREVPGLVHPESLRSDLRCYQIIQGEEP